MRAPQLLLDKMDPRGDLTLWVGAKQTDEGKEDTKPRCFLICSRTLARVSPVFDRMLNGSFAEANKPTDGTNWVVDFPADNPSAMVLFLHIAHGHHQYAPRAPSIEELYDLTLLTHFYDATWLLGALDPAVDEHAAPDGGPQIRCRRSAQDDLDQLGARAPGPGSMVAEGSVLRQLEMPSDIIERICTTRQETITALLILLRIFTAQLTVVDEQPRWCRHATFLGPHRCESMILGSLTFCLSRAGLWPLPSGAGDVGHSIVGLQGVLANLVIHDIGRSAGEGEPDHGACNPHEYLMGRVAEVLGGMGSLVGEAEREELGRQARRLHASVL